MEDEPNPMHRLIAPPSSFLSPSMAAIAFLLLLGAAGGAGGLLFSGFLPFEMGWRLGGVSALGGIVATVSGMLLLNLTSKRNRLLDILYFVLIVGGAIAAAFGGGVLVVQAVKFAFAALVSLGN